MPPVPTFGDIKQGLGGVYGATCLRLCGNGEDPKVSLTYEGSHADNFNDLYAAAVSINADGPALNAFTRTGATSWSPSTAKSTSLEQRPVRHDRTTAPRTSRPPTSPRPAADAGAGGAADLPGQN